MQILGMAIRNVHSWEAAVDVLANDRLARQKRSFGIFGFGKYGDARIFSAGMGFPDTKWIEQIFEVGGD